jgi:hypothetical protein
MSETPAKPRRKGKRRWVAACLSVVVLIVAVWSLHAWWTDRDPQPPTEIFRGVTYGCDQLTGPNARGLIHWVRIDLSVPGIEFYTTPLDAEAVAAGWQYRLAYTDSVVGQNRLAVAVNGVLFQRASHVPYPGAYARGSETLVSDHIVSHNDPGTFLLWFDDGLNPAFEATRPVDPKVLERAKWAIGGNLNLLVRGEVSRFTHDDRIERRTVIGIDPRKKLLFLAVMEGATERRAGVELARIGATDGILVDGGSSSELTIGSGARGVRPGNTIGTWAPAANHFGVRAKPIE